MYFKLSDVSYIYGYILLIVINAI